MTDISLLIIFFDPWTSCNETAYIVIIKRKAFSKYVKFLAPGSGVVVLGLGYMALLKIFLTPGYQLTKLSTYVLRNHNQPC